MQAALATLPWVEHDSFKANVAIQQVKFRVKDRASFDEEEVREAIKKQGFSGVTVKTIRTADS